MSVSYECIPPTSEADVIKYGGSVVVSSPPEHVHWRRVAAVVVRRGGGAAWDGRATTEPNCCLPPSKCIHCGGQVDRASSFYELKEPGFYAATPLSILHHSTVVEHPASTGRRRVGSLPEFELWRMLCLANLVT